MNHSINTRWKKKFFLSFCVLISLCAITIPSIYNRDIKADTTTFDDGPLGEKIVDIAILDNDTYLAVSESGNVYLWGNSLGLLGDGSTTYLTLPKKVFANANNNEYLTNIKKVYSGIANGNPSNKEGIAFALSNNNELYAWGDNTNYNLGLPDPKFYDNPTIVPLDSKIKNKIERIVFYDDVTALLTTDGEVYVTGKQGTNQDGSYGILGLGLSVTQTPGGFTKITQDNANDPIPFIKDIHLSGRNLFLLGNNNIYATGSYNFTGNAGESQTTAYPAPGRISDGSALNCTQIVLRTAENQLGVLGSDNVIYQSWNGNPYQRYYTPMNYRNSVTGAIEAVPETIINEFKNIKVPYVLSGAIVLTKDNHIQSWEKLFSDMLSGYPIFSNDSSKSYYKGEIPDGYQNAEKVIADNANKTMILSKNGGVYVQGKKVSFGDIVIKASKTNTSETYKSGEKYNDNISLEFISPYAKDQILYDEIDLLTSNKTLENTITNSLNTTLVDGVRTYKQYDVYIKGKKNDTVTTFIVDLYKDTPVLKNVTNNGKYQRGKKISLDDNGFSGNTVNGIIRDNNGLDTAYLTNTPLTAVGSFILKITDLYGNTNAYNFTISNQPVAQSVSFTPTDTNGLVYSNTITKAGSVIGTISLVYADGDTPSTIKTLTLGTDKDGPKFEKSGTNQLKVKGADLNAGTYVVPVSGTDQNDMPFSGEITIVIAKAASNMTWNTDTQNLSTDGLALGDEVTLGVKDQPSGTTVTYGMKTSNSCITLDTATGKVKATCVPSPASVTFTATPVGNGNYNLSTLELTVPIKKQSVTLNVELVDSDASYKNDVTIKIGGSLPTPRITSTDPTLDVSTLGTPTYTYKKNNVVVPNPSITEGIYTVSASYPSGSLAENYDITWINATLRVEGITIDKNNQSDYFTMTSDGKPYTQGTWTNKDIIITPVHATFNQIDIDDAGNKSTNDYTYSVAGDQTVKLSFYNSDGAKVSTTVNLKVDKTAPTISKFNYEDISNVQSFLRAITFDHFFGKAQRLSFSGSDEAGGSGLDHYQYEILELDADKNEKPASKKTGTLGLNEKLNLSINTSYRISAWAVDVAGNESDEKLERVYLSDKVAQLNITATSDGKAYDGSTWTKSGVTVKLSSTSGAGVEKYQYSSDRVVFHDLSGDTITLPDPLIDVDNVTYTFRAIHNDKTEADKTLNLKVDTVKPELNITGTVNGSPYDGSLADQNIELTMHQTNTNISGSTLYYTTSPTSKDTDPKIDSNWKRYAAPITHSANGTFTYYFKAISGAGIGSDPKEYTVKLAKKEYTNITINVTSEGKLYSPGNWAKGDVTFTLSGGLKDTTQITGYEYTATNGSKPTASSTWKQVTNKTLKLTNSVKDQTYWFRVTPIDSDGKMSSGTKVNLDVEAPSIPTMSVKELNKTRIAQLINLFSFGNWMNKQAEVTMSSSDSISGIDHYEYIETIEGTEAQPKSSSGTITYGDETELMLKARACDKAGNCSEYTNKEELKIDMKAPVITGVKDQNEYKQYYLPRFVEVTDQVSGLKEATYKKDNAQAVTFIDNVETEITEEGNYEIYAIDYAGNEITLTFKIVELPDIKTEIDGSDESREIIDQIIKELEEVKDKIDQTEKENYDKWINDAKDKWDSLRTKVVEDDKTTSKVEGQGDTTFDPKTELIVEEIPKDKVPVLPRNAIKTYDVRLMKGDKEILPNGDIKVYLPYNEKETPIVYEINDDGTIKELPSKKENSFVTFITDTLKKYAISNTAQKENKKDVCVVGPDNQLNTKDDVCGSDNSTKNDDGSVTVPDGGKVIFPDKEIDAPNGATINPDGSVDYPDGTHYDPDGNKTKDPDKKPDPKPNPDDNDNPSNDDKVCSVGADGKQNTNDDICGKPNGDGDKPIINPDGSITIPDGGSVIFPDGNEVELPDGGIIKPDGSVELPDGTIINPDGSKKDDINIDTDNDGKPDINIDINGDGIPDINIDTNNDGVPDINIDTTGDGKPDYNIDTNGDQKPDVNVGPLPKPWKPNTCHTVNKINYCTMHGLKPNINIDTNNDGIPDLNVDVDGDGSADLNIDTDFDNIPNIDIDSTGDGKPDLNIDRTGNGKADENIQEVTVWNPTDIVTVNGTTYGIMKALYQEPQPTPEPENPDPTPPTDDGQTKEPEPTPQPSVKGSYQASVGGAGTSDSTSMMSQWILFTGSLLILMVMKRKKSNS